MSSGGRVDRFASSPSMAQLLHELVRGYYWRCRMSNGAEFELWSAMKLSRTEARNQLLAFANGDYEGVYESADITSLWEARS